MVRQVEGGKVTPLETPTVSTSEVLERHHPRGVSGRPRRAARWMTGGRS